MKKSSFKVPPLTARLENLISTTTTVIGNPIEVIKKKQSSPPAINQNNAHMPDDDHTMDWETTENSPDPIYVVPDTNVFLHSFGSIKAIVNKG